MHTGLSPRLRGNLLVAEAADNPRRSIPAPAGEPQLLEDVLRVGRVYPRACGGTCIMYITRDLVPGLSPRLRGNQRRRRSTSCWPRSIPAPAGEPGVHLLAEPGGPVYPRACGGTAAGSSRVPGCAGLSPRLRGNLRFQLHLYSLGRSIPAPAGEPSEVLRK